MGYFPNGTEGMLYEQDFCERCLHNEGCAVWLAHTLRNYDECNKAESILHILIPRTKDGLGNEQCRMFVDETFLSPLARAQFRSQQQVTGG